MELSYKVAAVIFSLLISFFAGGKLKKKKDAADLKSTELENTEKAISIWRELAEGLSKKVDLMQQTQMQLLKENQELRDEVRQLRLLFSQSQKT